MLNWRLFICRETVFRKVSLPHIETYQLHGTAACLIAGCRVILNLS
jgi:hypothetical protein